MTSSPAVSQKSSSAYLRASLRTWAAQNFQGGLFPVQDHLSDLDSSSPVDTDALDNDQHASDCLLGIPSYSTSFSEPAFQARDKAVFIFSDSFSQATLEQTPIVPCSPTSPDLLSVIMQPYSRCSPSPTLIQNSFSSMDELLCLPFHSSTRVSDDINRWLINRRCSSVSSGKSKSSSAKKFPHRPPRPPILDDADMQDFLGQWIETEDSGRRGRRDDEEDAFIANWATTNDLCSSVPRSSTAPSRLYWRNAKDAAQDEVPETFASAVMRQCTIAQDNFTEEVDDCVREKRPSSRMDAHDTDFFDVWTPPPLRSTSSSSTLDHSFHLDLFSPASKGQLSGSVSVWDSSHASPIGTSNSPGYYSSSPFIGWSSIPLLSTKANVEASFSFDAVVLHQPQPIRPIPPIPIPSLCEESSAESDDVALQWTKDAITTRFTRSLFVELSPPSSPIFSALST